ncbi:hypothetical protein ACFRMQ_27285 [Kitasatospora sp. NPDC056783]|uniref:hypothetical protein n=1 Tax=Kitasatospora sp. NPDC056783 TaxID=3345943 RepID=UPI0036A42DB9
MTNRPSLHDACGPAGHVPALLERFAADPGGRWSELTDHLCPYPDTAYPASFAALPHLARTATATARTPGRLHPVLLAAGAITARAAPHGTPGGPLERFAAPIAVLHRLTDQALRTTHREQPYTEPLQCLLSFEGVEVRDRCLEGLHTGEYDIDCPHCGVHPCAAFHTEGVFHTGGAFRTADDDTGQDTDRTPPRPAAPHALEGLARRLRERALADGHEGPARAVTYLFGHASCPHCATAFSPAERVAARWIP